jgi:hypothetical protein
MSLMEIVIAQYRFVWGLPEGRMQTFVFYNSIGANVCQAFFAELALKVAAAILNLA